MQDFEKDLVSDGSSRHVATESKRQYIFSCLGLRDTKAKHAGRSYHNLRSEIERGHSTTLVSAAAIRQDIPHVPQSHIHPWREDRVSCNVCPKSALSGGPFALKKRLCLPTCVGRMILSDNRRIGRCSSLQALQYSRGCDTPVFSGQGT